MNRLFFRRSNSFSEKLAKTWPSRVKHETSRTLPFFIRSKWMAPPCARTCKTRCSCFEIFNGLSLGLTSAVEAPGISHRSLLVQFGPIAWTLAAGRNRRHKISIALRPSSACLGDSAKNLCSQAAVREIECNGSKVPYNRWRLSEFRMLPKLTSTIRSCAPTVSSGHFLVGNRHGR